jgi:16S rRNA (guanine966-N2)-methyltransferase
MFSILGNVEGDEVLDLFAGTGALGIEALSRGAHRATFVERAPIALRALRQNLRQLNLEERSRVVAAPVERVLASPPWSELAFDLVLIDPPYADLLGRTPAAHGNLMGRTRPTRLVPDFLQGIVSQVRTGGRVVLEHASRDVSPEIPGLQIETSRTYGDTALSFYQR